MKRMIYVAVLFGVLLGTFTLMTGCDHANSMQTDVITEATEPDYGSPDFPEELKAYLSPWNLDAVAEAKSTESIHYYFMSSKGMFMSEAETYPYKWGDSCLIIFPDGKTLLVDAGMEAYGKVLVENLRRMNIKRLDYVLFSHQHNDHTFGAIREGGVFDHFEIGQVYWNGIYNSNWKTLSLEQVCEERNIPILTLKRGDVLDFGVANAEILWPAEEMLGSSFDNAEDLNNYSIVMRLAYKEHTSLFTGDLYRTGEEILLNTEMEKLDADLLKVPHHGHNTSGTASFIGAVSPKLAVATGYTAVISKIITAYESVGATFLDDQYNGYIHVASDGTELTYDTARSRGDDK